MGKRRYFTADGRPINIRKRAAELGITKGSLYERIRTIGLDQALSARRTEKTMLTHNGETHSITEWAEIKGISRAALQARLDKMPAHQALSVAVRYHLHDGTRRAQWRNRLASSQRRIQTERASHLDQGALFGELFTAPSEPLTTETAWRLYRDGNSGIEIAAQYNQTPETVYRLLRQHPDFDQLSKDRLYIHRALVLSEMWRVRQGRRYEYNGQRLTLKQWAEKKGLSYKHFLAKLRDGLTLAEIMEEGPKTVEYHGEMLLVDQVAAKLGITKAGVEKRLREGRSVDIPRQKNRPIEHNGRTQTIRQWAAEFGVNEATLRFRLKKYGFIVKPGKAS
jgi:hypothetical protein